jgi:hypothetical protein
MSLTVKLPSGTRRRLKRMAVKASFIKIIIKNIVSKSVYIKIAIMKSGECYCIKFPGSPCSARLHWCICQSEGFYTCLVNNFHFCCCSINSFKKCVSDNHYCRFFKFPNFLCLCNSQRCINNENILSFLIYQPFKEMSYLSNSIVDMSIPKLIFEYM